MTQVTIHRAYFIETEALGRGPGSSLVRDLLIDLAGPRICLVWIERSDGRFALALDAAWAELGVDVSELPGSGPDDLTDMKLPRRAVRAVISGWPDEWDRMSQPQVGVHLSDDDLPHISLSDALVQSETPNLTPRS